MVVCKYMFFKYNGASKLWTIPCYIIVSILVSHDKLFYPNDILAYVLKVFIITNENGLQLLVNYNAEFDSIFLTSG